MISADNRATMSGVKSPVISTCQKHYFNYIKHGGVLVAEKKMECYIPSFSQAELQADVSNHSFVLAL